MFDEERKSVPGTWKAIHWAPFSRWGNRGPVTADYTKGYGSTGTALVNLTLTMGTCAHKRTSFKNVSFQQPKIGKCSFAPECRQSQYSTAYITTQWFLNRRFSSSNSEASQSINIVCVTLETDSLWKVDLNYFSEQKFLLFLASLFKNVYIYIT